MSQRSLTYKNTRSVNCFVASSPKALFSLEALASRHFHRLQAQILHSGFTSSPCSESRLWSLIETTSQWQNEVVQATIKLYMCFGNAFGTQIRAGNLKSNRQITEGGNSFGVHMNNLKTKPLTAPLVECIMRRKTQRRETGNQLPVFCGSPHSVIERAPKDNVPFGSGPSSLLLKGRSYCN